MDSSSASSSDRRHSVPETYYVKYRERSPDPHKEKMTKDKYIQTDNKLPAISKTSQSSHRHSCCKPCGHHSHSRRKRFKRINQGDLINMILKTGQVSLKEKSSSRALDRRSNRKKERCENSETSTKNIQKLENQIMRLFRNNSKENSAKCLSESEYSNFLPNIQSSEYPRLCYSSESMKSEDQDLHEAILKLQNGDKIVRNTVTQMFDIQNDQSNNGYDKTDDYLICFDDNDEIGSCVLQSLNDTYSKALTTRSSSDYCLSSYATGITDRTVSTLSIQTSSSPLDDIRRRLVNNVTEEMASLPKSPRLFPLVIDAESLLSEPLKSGYIPSTQMKLISVHFLDSDSENNGANNGYVYRNHSYSMLQPSNTTKEDVVIFEVETEKKDNLPQQQNYNNISKNSLISEIKHDPENKQLTSEDKILFNQPASSVIHHKKVKRKDTKEKAKDTGKDMSYMSCSCASPISSVMPLPFREPCYDTPLTSAVPSSMPKSYPMLVNASSKYRNYSSDSSDDEVSNPDSLEDVSTKQRCCYNKYDEKIVRGDTSSLVLERQPRKRSFSFAPAPYFITLNEDKIYSLHHVKYKLPDHIKKKLMNRERKLRKHSREKCKHCSKACVVKKSMRKKHQLKAKQQHKVAKNAIISIVNDSKLGPKNFSGHDETKLQCKKQNIRHGHESFRKHTCSNTIVVQEIRNDNNGVRTKMQLGSDSNPTPDEDKVLDSNNGSKSMQNLKKHLSTQTSRDSKVNRRKTSMIRNHFTQTSLEENRTTIQHMKENQKVSTKKETTTKNSTNIKEIQKSSNKHEESTMTIEKEEENQNIKYDPKEEIKSTSETLRQPFKRQQSRDLEPIKRENNRIDSEVENKENVTLKNITSETNNINKSQISENNKYCFCDSKNDKIQENAIGTASMNMNRSFPSDSRSISDRSRYVDDELDKAIMYILLDGLMQGEKENAERENKKSIAIQVKSQDNIECDTHPIHNLPSEFGGKGCPSKYTKKFDSIPEEESFLNSRNVYGSPLDYTERVHHIPSKKKEPCHCIEDVDTRRDLTKEVEKYQDYLLHKEKSQFHEEDCHPEIRETAEPRKFSSVSNVSIESIDMINTRRNKANGNMPTILNYKRAMMVGTFTPFNQQEEESKEKRVFTVEEHEQLSSKEWTPTSHQEEGSKGKKALTVGKQEELLSKGWINFYLLKGGDCREFSDAEDDYTCLPNFEINDIIPKDAPIESFYVEVKSKPESVLPIIPNKTQNKPNQVEVPKPKGGTLPALNVKSKKESSVPPKKSNAHSKCLLENTELNSKKPKTRRFGNRLSDSQRTTKSRQSLKPQKIEETKATEIINESNNNIEVSDPLGQVPVKEPMVLSRDLQPMDTPADSFVSANFLDDIDHHTEFESYQKEQGHSQKDLDHTVNDYDCPIRTVSPTSVQSGSDDSQKMIDPHKLIESQKQIARKSSKPYREREFQSQLSTKPPYSEHNWKVTVASEKSNKQTSPNIELHLSMNSSEQNEDRQKSNPRQSKKINLSLTLKNVCAVSDSDISSSSRQDNFYDKEKQLAEIHEYSKKHYKNITQAEDTGSVRSSTAMSFHEDQEKDHFTSSKRTENLEEGQLSVTGSYITPELRRKPPTMSEKNPRLYKNSKK